MNSKKVNWLFLTIILVHIGVVLGINLYSYFVTPLYLSIVPNLLLSQAMVFVPAFLFALFSKEKLNTVYGFHKIKISSVFMIILFTFLMTPMTAVINAISMLFVDNTVASMSSYIMEMPMIVMVLAMGVIGPISEEMVFRGVVFNGYKRSGNTVCAILFSALLFGLMHMNFNQAAYAIFLGIVMAVVVEATGSLWGSAIFHMTVNIQSIVVMYMSDAIYSDDVMQEAEVMTNETEYMLAVIGVYAVVAMVTTAIAVCVLAWVAKNEKRDMHLRQIWAERKEKRGTMASIPLIIGIVLSVAYMILDVILL